MIRGVTTSIRVRTRRLLRLWVPAALALLATACAKIAPQSVLEPEGPIARTEDRLFRPVFWIAVAVFVIVEGLIVIALASGRRRKETPAQVHGNKRLEVALTVAPALLLAGIAVPTVLTIFDVSEVPTGSNVMHVKVTAHQWWWRYEYSDIDLPGGAGKLQTANELHIPVGRPVLVELESADVIHSFWVPKLAGKQDVVPGKTNHLTLIAERPGEYYGQCAEFCALSHANMRLRVFAESPADFDAWLKGQVAPAARPNGDALEGARIFLGAGNCLNCHAVGGLEIDRKAALATFGPNLTHVASRSTFGGAIYAFNARNLARWLRDPVAAKPGNRMVNCSDEGAVPPNCVPKLNDRQIELLIAFLMSLK